MFLKPSEIRFSQKNVKNCFKDENKMIGETLDDICEGRCAISDIPKISVKKMKDGRIVTADNRRLWVFQHLEKLGKCTEIQVLKTKYIKPKKLNSENGGTSVKIRGNNDPGGFWYKRISPQSHSLSQSNPNPDRTQYGLKEEPQQLANVFGQQPTCQISLENLIVPARISQTHDAILEIESPRYGRSGKQTHDENQEQQHSPVSVEQSKPEQLIYQRKQSKATGLNIVDAQLRELSLIDSKTNGERIGKEPQTDRAMLGSMSSSDKDANSAKQAVKIPTAVHPNITRVKKEGRLVAAIDFGTTFSGYAFSFHTDFKEDPLKIVTNQWGTGSNKNLSLKTSSCILFDPEQKFNSFGFDAENMYAELAAEERHIDWYYFKQFKMLLYENKDLSRRTILNDDNGKPMQALTVFAESIKFLKQHLLDSCTGRCFGLREDEIHWVLTVPAIWDDSAKQFMRKAATEAGIDSNRLLLALEPEAASMFCKYMPVNKMQGAKKVSISCFKPGLRYMVLDAGGGTVDITVHETKRDHTVRELVKANGGPWGGTKVDEAFCKFLAEISSDETLQQFKLTHMDDYLDTMREFETKKSTTTPELDQRVTFKIPLSFHETYASLHDEELRINRTIKDHFGQKISFTRDKLRVYPEVIQEFFTESCEAIVSHLKGVFRQREVRNTNTILMVGGFSESRMLQAAIKRHFPEKQVIIPADAGLAVLKGAVIYGHNPSVITSRISKFTYGVGTNTLFRTGYHPIEKYFEAEGEAYCSKVFDIHVNIGDEVEEGTSFQTQTYTPIYSTATHLSIKLYTTDKMNPSYTDETGCRKLGSINVDLSNLMQESDKAVDVTMKYGGTELHVEAKVVETGHTKHASFEFLCKP